MTLTFTQENGLYVAEFEATAPFSIHIERPKGGFINMLQRSVDSGTFVAVKNFNPNYNATQVIDADCGQGAVYPKWIRLESAVEPSVAEVTFESESSGGGAGTESTMEYVAFNAETDLVTYGEMLGIFAYLVKFPTKIETISIMVMSDETVNDAIAFAIDTGAVVDFMGSRKSIKDLALSLGADISSLPHLTKEQFYSLEA